jgi:hypothetical protein
MQITPFHRIGIIWRGKISNNELASDGKMGTRKIRSMEGDESFNSIIITKYIQQQSVTEHDTQQ